MTKGLPQRLLAGVVLAGLAGCGSDAGAPAKPAGLVKVETVRFVDYAPVVALTGEIAPQVQSDLSFRVSGRITARLVDVGTHVTADQVLARVDPEEQRAAVAAAEASVAAGEAQVRQTSSAFDRQNTLLAQGFTTRREFDQAQEVFRTAQGSLDSARAQLATARDLLTQTELKAGVAGVITSRDAEVGQVAQAAKVVFTIAQDGPRDAVFNVPESVMVQEPGDGRIDISLVSDPTVRVEGKVREVAPTVDPLGGTVKVKIGIAAAPSAMTLGAAVTGVAAFKPRKAILLPWSALSSKDGNPAVWIVDPATKAATLKSFTIDRYDTGFIVARSGLQIGDIVVTSGAQLLRPNQIVAFATEKGK